jgi:hypothetical protein
MSANEPQTLRNEYSRSTKILDADCKPESLDDVIKTCENFWNSISLRYYSKNMNLQYLFDGTLGEFNMEY